MAAIYQAQERLDLAVQNYQRAYELALDAHGNDLRHPGVLEVRYGYANTLEMDGRPREALAHAQAVATLGAEVFGADSEMLGYFLGSLANIQLDLGEIRAAIENSRRSLAIYHRTKQPGTRDHSIRMRLLSRELLAARQPREAAETARGLARDRDQARQCERAPMERGALRARPGAISVASTRRRPCSDPSSRADEDSWSRARVNALWRLGTLRRLQGIRGALSRGSSRPSRTRASDLAASSIAARFSPRSVRPVRISGPSTEPPASSSAALELLQRVQLRDTPAQADALVGLGRADLGLGRPAAAVAPLERADAFWREFDAENRWSGEAALWLGRCLLALGRKTEAQATLSRAEGILSRSRLPSDRKLVQLARQP